MNGSGRKWMEGTGLQSKKHSFNLARFATSRPASEGFQSGRCAHFRFRQGKSCFWQAEFSSRAANQFLGRVVPENGR